MGEFGSLQPFMFLSWSTHYKMAILSIVSYKIHFLTIYIAAVACSFNAHLENTVVLYLKLVTDGRFEFTSWHKCHIYLTKTVVAEPEDSVPLTAKLSRSTESSVCYFCLRLHNLMLPTVIWNLSPNLCSSHQYYNIIRNPFVVLLIVVTWAAHPAHQCLPDLENQQETWLRIWCNGRIWY
jgi:hypothetical protein